MTPPKIIYLQLYDEDGEELDATYDEVTWCEDRINETDVAYIRAEGNVSRAELVMEELGVMIEKEMECKP